MQLCFPFNLSNAAYFFNAHLNQYRDFYYLLKSPGINNL